MTNRGKDRAINAAISLGLVVTTVLFSNFMQKKNNNISEHEEKIKTDTKTEIIEELEPKFKEKLDEKVFNAHVKDNEKEFQNINERQKDNEEKIYKELDKINKGQQKIYDYLLNKK